jgi:hypothetical protein
MVAVPTGAQVTPAQTISIRLFNPKVFLALVSRPSHNVGVIRSVLLPLALLLMVPVLVLSYSLQPTTFFCTLGSLGLYTRGSRYNGAKNYAKPFWQAS